MSHPDESKHVRELLTTRRNSLRDRHTKVQRDLARKNDPLVADSADRAIQLENDQALEAIDAAAVSEIAAIDAALRRLDNGLYGICSRCEEPIEAGRLRSVPYATTCTRCAGA